MRVYLEGLYSFKLLRHYTTVLSNAESEPVTID